MQFGKILITLLILLQTTFVFPFPWGAIWEAVKGPLWTTGGNLFEDWLMPSSPSPSSPPSQEQIASLKELQTLNINVETAIKEIINFKTELLKYLEERELSNVFTKIRSWWIQCVDILETQDAGDFENEEHFQRTFQGLRDQMSEIFFFIEKIRYDQARIYLEKVREELITSGADIITYCVKLTLAIKDYVVHTSQVIGLLKVCLSSDPQFKNSITRLTDDLKDFKGYHEQYVLGSWFNWTGHLINQGGEYFYSDKILKILGSQSHIVHWQQEAYFGASSGWVTPFRMRSWKADIGDIGNVSIFIEFQIAGTWRKLCASAEPLSVKLDCEDEESKKWKPIPCPSSLTANEAHLDHLCVKHVATGLFLTYLPSLENPGSLTVSAFDENNGNQLFNLTDVRRCCQISSNSSLIGNNSKEICLDVNQAYQEALVLPEGMEPFAFGVCESDVRLFAFEGENFSKGVYTVNQGTQASFEDASQATSLRSYYVESVCARIFTDQNLTGEYTSICGDMPNLGEKFIGKNVSVLVASRPLELFDGPDYTGNSIIIRRPMKNLEDWPFEVRSIRFTQ